MAKKEPKVRLTITTDLWYTAEFLRELASQIEEWGPYFNTLDTYCGKAKVEWPEEAYEEEDEAGE